MYIYDIELWGLPADFVGGKKVYCLAGTTANALHYWFLDLGTNNE